MDKQKIVDGLEKVKDVSVTAVKKTADEAKNTVLKAKDVAASKVKNTVDEISEVQFQHLLDEIYGKAVDGITKVSEPLDDMIKDYTEKYKSKKEAINALIRVQIAKCGVSGFVTGIGGITTLGVTIPANICSVLFIQLRMIAAIASIAGFDPKSDQVQTLSYACLAGNAAAEIIKGCGVKAGGKVGIAAVNKIPGEVLKKINKEVGFRLITKAGKTGIINLTKLVPIIGGAIGGGIDIATTKVIAQNAVKIFVGDENIEDYIDVEEKD